MSHVVSSQTTVEALELLSDPDGPLDATNCPVTFLLHQTCVAGGGYPVVIVILTDERSLT